VPHDVYGPPSHPVVPTENALAPDCPGVLLSDTGDNSTNPSDAVFGFGFSLLNSAKRLLHLKMEQVVRKEARVFHQNEIK
jgi:hypothetical protein